MIVGVGVSLLFATLDATGVLKTLPWWLWLIFGGAACVGAGGYALGRGSGLAQREPELRYAQHLSDALDTLQKVLSGTIPQIRVGEFIQEGIFEPAHALLAHDRGDVRFSLLEPDGDNFTMPMALGHSLEGRRDFQLRIDDSFAGLAFRRGEIAYSDDTQKDDRFAPHPKARREREYRSIVCIPLREKNEIWGVLVVVATKPRAFTDTDRAYIQVLSSIVDVTKAVRAPDADGDQSGG